MKFTEKHIVIIATEVIVAVVILGALCIKNSGSATVNTQAQTPAAGDSMADHHKPKPADSAIFDSLINTPAPDFTAPSYDGKTISLKDFRGKNVVLFFNEGLMCYPACWNQIIAFGQDKDFAAKNTAVFNITVNTKEEWKQAIDKMPELAGNTVLLDPDRSVSNLFGVLTLNSSMHRGQFPGHTYILIDKDGIVRSTLDDAQMAVRNKEMLAEVAKL